jgi:hypothetical protein
MKKFLTLAAIASGLFLVSCTAETDSIEPTQNLEFNQKIELNQNMDESILFRDVDSLDNTANTTEGEPYIKKDKD